MKAAKSLQAIYAVVKRIPRGRVSTYGRVAELSGLPRRARLVGRALRELPPDSGVPWHRVVNAAGKISSRGDALGHEDLQAHLLEREHVSSVGNVVPLEHYLWQPARARPGSGKTSQKTNDETGQKTSRRPTGLPVKRPRVKAGAAGR